MTDAGLARNTLVVGYGNDLRSDDGAGRWVADAVEDLDLEGVDVRSVSQLTPEVALEAAGRRLVVFVDASVDTTVLTVAPVEPNANASPTMGHHGDPGVVLSMVAQVGEPPEEAWLVSIPATNLGLGFDMTPQTQTASEVAVTRIVDLTLGFEAGGGLRT